MKCEEIRDLLTEVIEQADPLLDQRTGPHLKECSQCRSFAAELLAAWKLLDAWPEVDTSEHFRARFWKRVEEEERSGVRRFGRYFRGPWVIPVRAAVIAALMLACGVAIWLATRQSGDPSQQSVPAWAVSSDDDQLLLSLSRLSEESTATHSLEAYDLWGLNGEGSESLPLMPASDEEGRKNREKGGITHEKTG